MNRVGQRLYRREQWEGRTGTCRCCRLCIYMPAIDRSLSLIAGTYSTRACGTRMLGIRSRAGQSDAGRRKRNRRNGRVTAASGASAGPPPLRRTADRTRRRPHLRPFRLQLRTRKLTWWKSSVRSRRCTPSTTRRSSAVWRGFWRSMQVLVLYTRNDWSLY